LESIKDIKQFGRYQISGMVGKGAMGYVFKAYDPKLDRIVALKTLQWDSKVSELKKDHYYKRFIQEAKITGRLRHPGIVMFYDFGEENNIPYITMEFITGNDLDKMIKDKSLSIDDIKKITTETLEALSYAHAQGIVHRDLKPGNIMISTKNEVKIADFGIAHVDDSDLTKTGSVVGSPNYMSPEQVKGRKIDNRSDLFSFGITLYYMLTGKKPFSGSNISETIHNVIEVNPKPPSILNDKIPEGWDYIVEKLLEKDREVRYQNCQEVINDINKMAENTDTIKNSSSTENLDNSLDIDNIFSKTINESSESNENEPEDIKLDLDYRIFIIIFIIIIIFFLLYMLWR